MEIQSKYDVIIIGGGVYGLSIAYYLSKKQDLKIALLQQYAIGHNKGSSHSTTRITRSLYENQLYRDLNLECLNKNWPEMEKVLKTKLIYSTEFIYFDDNQSSYLNQKNVAQSSPQQNTLICKSFEEYKQYFKGRKAPYIQSKYPPIIDKKAGVIYSSLYIKRLQEYLSNDCQNVTLIEHTQVKSINQNQNQVSVETQNDILRANKVILSCGKWIKEMAPEISEIFTPMKQFLSFLELQHQFEFSVEKYPSFAYKQKNGQLFYSVPDDTIQKLGLKLGQHKSNQSTNPDAMQNTLEYNYQQFRKKALSYFGQDFIRVKTVEQCYYTYTKSNDFVIDWIGESQKILVCSCCSGHAFKFAPIIGEIISEIVNSRSQQQKQQKQRRKINSTYKKFEYKFKIPYHKGVNLE